MRRKHFEAFAPVCPVCARVDRQARLGFSHVVHESADEVHEGILVCEAPACRHEYPVLGGIPVLAADLGRLLGERGVELMLRDDISPVLESLLGDAIGPDSWFDVLRQTVSTYAWDSYAALDGGEPVAAEPAPGAASRCLARLLAMGGLPGAHPVGRVVDLGSGAGGSSFALAGHLPGALVLGLDMHLGLLRVAAAAGRGRVAYPRRRIGLVYDRRDFAVSLPGADRVDFWAADALALPLASGVADVGVALNLLDCVPDPRGLLAAMGGLLAPGGTLLLATPFDWSARATAAESWIGGHSQRGAHRGAAEPFLGELLTESAHPGSIAALVSLGEGEDADWHTRLHDRSFVRYRTHLRALRKT